MRRVPHWPSGGGVLLATPCPRNCNRQRLASGPRRPRHAQSGTSRDGAVAVASGGATDCGVGVAGTGVERHGSAQHRMCAVRPRETAADSGTDAGRGPTKHGRARPPASTEERWLSRGLDRGQLGVGEPAPDRDVATCCRDRPSDTTSTTFPNSGEGRTPLIGAFRLSPRRMPSPRM